MALITSDCAPEQQQQQQQQQQQEASSSCSCKRRQLRGQRSRDILGLLDPQLVPDPGLAQLARQLAQLALVLCRGDWR